MDEAEQLPVAPEAPPPDMRQKLAEKAEDLDAIKKAVEDAASTSGSLWLTYLFVLFYVAVAAGAVTHEDLLLERAVKLPFLNIELPLKAFFVLAPILFLVSHAYTLAHFRLLADKAKRFHNQLFALLPGEKDAETREGLRGQLPSNILVQFLAGPKDIRGGWFGALLTIIFWTTLVIGPLLLLLLLQLQFLPYHAPWITFWHRVWLLVDLALIWPLWHKILAARYGQHSRGARRWALLGGVVASILVVGFSWLAAFPGEREAYSVFASFPWAEKERVSTAPERTLEKFGLLAKPDVISPGQAWFTGVLFLPEFDIYEALNIDDPKKFEWKEHSFSFRGRHLEGAILSGAKLVKVDLRLAHLDGALLDDAQFQGASLQGASFEEASLQRASLKEQQLQHANLRGADLRGAMLERAQLQSANLRDAWLHGAMLAGAHLQGASLDNAELQGASLEGAELQGASLEGAELQGASLAGAQLEGAWLIASQLQGASLDGTRLRGASLDGAWLHGASLKGADLRGASLDSAYLQGASLDGARFEATDLSHSLLWRTEWGVIKSSNMTMIRLGGVQWKAARGFDVGYVPLPWTTDTYASFRRDIEGIREGKLQNEALKRIKRLDCSNADEILASCDATVPLPQATEESRRMLENASVDDVHYETALATTLRELVCAGGPGAFQILRGLAHRSLDSAGRLSATGREATTLVNAITSEDCPVSAQLTKDDKAMLRALAEEAPSARKK